MGKYKIAIFDLDGTLLDTSNGIVEAIHSTIKAENLPQLPQEVMRGFIGPPIQDSFAKTYNLSEEQAFQLSLKFREIYVQPEYILNAEPYCGIFETFEKLCSWGIKLAVATYKREDLATFLLNSFGFNKYTTAFYGADFNNTLKKVDIIKKCLDNGKIDDYNSAVMIGDSYHDALGAKQLGVPFLGVTYGFGFKTTEEKNAYPHIGFVNNAHDIIKYFEQ
jgi:phosphoglycolate phosphatase